MRKKYEKLEILFSYRITEAFCAQMQSADTEDWYSDELGEEEDV